MILKGREEDIKSLLPVAPIDESSLQGTPLNAAAMVGRSDLVQALLQRGADPNATIEIGKQTALYQAAERGHVGVVRILSSRTDRNILAHLNWTPLHSAAIAGHTQIVEDLLDARFDRDAQDECKRTALALSVQQGHLGVIKLLLKNGAQDLPDEEKDHALDHAVCFCSGKDNEEILKLLRGENFTKMKLTSRLAEKYNRRNGWKLGTLGGLALYRALK